MKFCVIQEKFELANQNKFTQTELTCNERKDCENEIALFAELVKSYNAQCIKARVKNEWNIPQLMADVKEFKKLLAKRFKKESSFKK